MAKYIMAPERYTELLDGFDLLNIRVSSIQLETNPELEPDDFLQSKLVLLGKKPKWKFPKVGIAIAVTTGEFRASAELNCKDRKEAFVSLRYAIETVFTQSEKFPLEFYRIFAEQSLWRIVSPFTRELVTNIPHRAGYTFPPPPLAVAQQED